MSVVVRVLPRQQHEQPGQSSSPHQGGERSMISCLPPNTFDVWHSSALPAHEQANRLIDHAATYSGGNLFLLDAGYSIGSSLDPGGVSLESATSVGGAISAGESTPGQGPLKVTPSRSGGGVTPVGASVASTPRSGVILSRPGAGGSPFGFDWYLGNVGGSLSSGARNENRLTLVPALIREMTHGEDCVLVSFFAINSYKRAVNDLIAPFLTVLPTDAASSNQIIPSLKTAMVSNLHDFENLFNKIWSSPSLIEHQSQMSFGVLLQSGLRQRTGACHCIIYSNERHHDSLVRVLSNAPLEGKKPGGVGFSSSLAGNPQADGASESLNHTSEGTLVQIRELMKRKVGNRAKAAMDSQSTTRSGQGVRQNANTARAQASAAQGLPFLVLRVPEALKVKDDRLHLRTLMLEYDAESDPASYGATTPPITGGRNSPTNSPRNLGQQQREGQDSSNLDQRHQSMREQMPAQGGGYSRPAADHSGVYSGPPADYSGQNPQLQQVVGRDQGLGPASPEYQRQIAGLREDVHNLENQRGRGNQQQQQPFENSYQHSASASPIRGAWASHTAGRMSDDHIDGIEVAKQALIHLKEEREICLNAHEELKSDFEALLVSLDQTLHSHGVKTAELRSANNELTDVEGENSNLVDRTCQVRALRDSLTGEMKEARTRIEILTTAEKVNELKETSDRLAAMREAYLTAVEGVHQECKRRVDKAEHQGQVERDEAKRVFQSKEQEALRRISSLEHSVDSTQQEASAAATELNTHQELVVTEEKRLVELRSSVQTAEAELDILRERAQLCEGLVVHIDDIHGRIDSERSALDRLHLDQSKMQERQNEAYRRTAEHDRRRTTLMTNVGLNEKHVNSLARMQFCERETAARCVVMREEVQVKTDILRTMNRSKNAIRNRLPSSPCKTCSRLEYEHERLHKELAVAKGKEETQKQVLVVLDAEMEQRTSSQNTELSNLQDRIKGMVETIQRSREAHRTHVQDIQHNLRTDRETRSSLFTELRSQIHQETYLAISKMRATENAEGEASPLPGAAANHGLPDQQVDPDWATSLDASLSNEESPGPRPEKVRPKPTRVSRWGDPSPQNQKQQQRQPKPTKEAKVLLHPTRTNENLTSAQREAQEDEVCNLYLRWLESVHHSKMSADEASRLRSAILHLENGMESAAEALHHDRALLGELEDCRTKLQKEVSDADQVMEQQALEQMQHRKEMEKTIEEKLGAAQVGYKESVTTASGIMARVSALQRHIDELRREANEIGDELSLTGQPVQHLEQELILTRQETSALLHRLDEVRNVNPKAAATRQGGPSTIFFPPTPNARTGANQLCNKHVSPIREDHSVFDSPRGRSTTVLPFEQRRTPGAAADGGGWGKKAADDIGNRSASGGSSGAFQADLSEMATAASFNMSTNAATASGNNKKVLRGVLPSPLPDLVSTPKTGSVTGAAADNKAGAH